MANIIDNTIMNSSVLWPTSPQEVGKRLPAGQVNTDLSPSQSALVLRSPVAESGRGWLPMGSGEKVDLMA
jgi:hypothetical protein